MNKTYQLRISRLLTDIIRRDLLEDRAEYDIQGLMEMYDLDERGANLLLHLITSMMRA